ncbi:MAG: 1-deoxy-D-xylulose-5-phosphate reductoisomerase [Sphingomonadales bacterium]
MVAPLKRPGIQPKTVSVLGATGSVGCNTLDLVRRNPDRYAIEALTANRNIDLLVAQAREFRPRLAVIADPTLYAPLKAALSGTGIEVASGPAAVVEAAARPAGWVMAAIVGAAGLAPTLAAIRRGATVALANKECLVCAGDLVMAEVDRCAATLLPVDSEHNAIFQVFNFEDPSSVASITLTASGGPFRTFTRAEMALVTPEQAVAHPNWDMGAKISVDSATMFNKGLELIEACHLFPVEAASIDILVHPQSVIHSLVSYVDGSVLAQLGTPDMRTPIAYALGWPDRIAAPATRLNLAEIGQLDFEAPDPVRFPALRFAREALEEGGAAPTILNAANEVAVAGFLTRKIGFLHIAEVVQTTLETVSAVNPVDIDAVMAVDGEARRKATEIMGELASI